MFSMFGPDGYSTRMANARLFVRRRKRAPLGHFAQSQTSVGNLSRERAGNRTYSPPFSDSHGRPSTSKVVGAIHRSGGRSSQYAVASSNTPENTRAGSMPELYPGIRQAWPVFARNSLECVVALR